MIFESCAVSVNCHAKNLFHIFRTLRFTGRNFKYDFTGILIGCDKFSRQGIINEDQITDILSRQLKVDKYHPDRYPIDMSLSRLIPIETAQKFQVALAVT